MNSSLALRPRHAVLLVVVFAAAALTLHAMGRPWWCRAGDPSLWSGEVLSRHNSQHLADPYTATHVLHGLAAYALLWALARRFASPLARAWIGLALETAWEIGENTDSVIERYRAATISLDYYGDSVANSLGDLAAFVLGYLGASVLPVWISAAGFVVVEAVLLLWIRDSLLLNVLMLLHPVERLKAWQLGGRPG